MRVSHTWTRLVAVAAALCVCAPAPASATILHPVPGAADNNATDGICTLREAITASNEVTPAPDCGTGSGTDTIMLAPGTYDLTLPGADDANATGDLDVIDNVIIEGGNPDSIKIDAHGVDRIFDIYGGINATIKGVTLTGGHAPNGANGTTSVGDPGSAGGAILAGGDLTLDSVVLTGNSSGDGGNGGTSGATGASGGNGGPGGAIRSNGALVISNSTLTNNTAGKGGAGGASGPGASDQAGPGGGGGHGGAIWADGAATITNTTFSGNHAGMGGSGGPSATGLPGGAGPGGWAGALRSLSTLTLSGSTLTGNVAGTGGSAAAPTQNGATAGGFAGNGGALAADTVSGDIKISDSTIANNRAGDGGSGPRYIELAPRGGDGGGIYLLYGKVTIERTTISGNRSGDGQPGSQAGGGGNGGGIFVGPLVDGTLTDSTINGNTAGNGGASDYVGPGNGGNGGGIYAVMSSNHSFAATNSTITGNQTGPGGDAKVQFGSQGGHGGLGGGIYAGDKVTLTHVTIAGNQTGGGGTGEVPGAPGPGGGIQSSDGTATLRNSIVASNAPSNCSQGAGTIADGGHNVSFGDATCPGVNGDPKLAPLLSAGGPTQTMALAEGSSAIDIVPADAGCTAADQRGVPRPQRAACDAGAYEAVATPVTPLDQQPPGGGQPAAKDKTPPIIKLLLKKQKLLKALKKGYFAFFSDNETGTAAADLFAGGKTAKGTAAAKRKRVAHGTLEVTKTGKQKLVVKFTKKAKQAFKKRKKVTLTLVLTAKDAAGNATKKTAKVVLKR